MIPSMQGSVFAPDLQLMTIAAYACFPQPLGPGFEGLTEPPIGEPVLGEKFRRRCRDRDWPTRSPLRHFRKMSKGVPGFAQE
jgi:hypothetical protein